MDELGAVQGNSLSWGSFQRDLLLSKAEFLYLTAADMRQRSKARCEIDSGLGKQKYPKARAPQRGWSQRG